MPDRAPPNFNREPLSPSPEPQLSEKQLKVEAKTPRTPSPIPLNSREIVYDDVTEGEEGDRRKKTLVPRAAAAANVFSTHSTLSVGMASN